MDQEQHSVGLKSALNVIKSFVSDVDSKAMHKPLVQYFTMHWNSFFGNFLFIFYFYQHMTNT